MHKHSVPLSYVRDVTYDQSLLQKMIGVSSVTVPPSEWKQDSAFQYSLVKARG
jgi:uncharacterized membrane protein YdbT with pleckstrin-like domain